MTIRDPDEIAASLARRDGLPAVQSQASWLQHLLDGEHATRGHARVFVHYERLLADWRAELKRITTALRIDWPVAPPTVDAEIDAFISPSLRHHRGSASPAGARQPELVRRAYALACDAAAGSAVAMAFDVIADFSARCIAAPLYRELSAVRQPGQQHGQQIDEAGIRSTSGSAIAQARAIRRTRRSGRSGARRACGRATSSRVNCARRPPDERGEIERAQRIDVLARDINPRARRLRKTAKSNSSNITLRAAHRVQSARHCA